MKENDNEIPPEIDEDEDEEEYEIDGKDVSAEITQIYALFEQGKSISEIISQGYNQDIVFTLWKEYSERKKSERESERKMNELKEQIAEIQKQLVNIANRPPTVVAPPQPQQVVQQPTSPPFGSMEYYMKRQDEKIDKLEMRLMEAEKEKVSLLLKMMDIGRKPNEYDELSKTLLTNLLNKTINNTLNPPPPQPSGTTFGERVIMKVLEPKNIDAILKSISKIGMAITSYKDRPMNYNPYEVKQYQQMPQIPENIQIPASSSSMNKSNSIDSENLSDVVTEYISKDSEPKPISSEITENDYLNHIVPEFTNDMGLALPIIKAVMSMNELNDPNEKLKLMQQAVKSADTMTILCTMIRNTLSGDTSIEDVADQIQSVNADELLLSKSFDEWLSLSKAFSGHPALKYEYEFLNGAGKENAQKIYNLIKERKEKSG